MFDAPTAAGSSVESGKTNQAPYVQSGDELNAFLRTFWQRQVDQAEQEPVDPRHPALPLARIKKVMKSDPEVKHMIAADAPIIFCKACELFIAEVTARAFLQADASKRRTLSRQDVQRALAGADTFDFLIDIVPRETTKPTRGAGKRKPDAEAAQVPQPQATTSGGESAGAWPDAYAPPIGLDGEEPPPSAASGLATPMSVDPFLLAAATENGMPAAPGAPAPTPEEHQQEHTA